MTPVHDHDLVADNEVEIAAPCRMILDDHFGNRDDVDALGHYRSGRQREIDVADSRNAAAFEHSLANAGSLLARERRIAAAAFLDRAALADLALASAALGHASFASSLTAFLARLALGPLPGGGLPVTLPLALPRLLSLTLFAFAFSLAACARLLAALTLFPDIALLALSLPGRAFLPFLAALALFGLPALALPLAARTLLTSLA
jgi:hypothetical protein